MNFTTLRVRDIDLHLQTSTRGFMPSTASMLLANNFSVNHGERVCDLGTGNGLQALVAAKCGAISVAASETNIYDVEIARANVIANDVERTIKVYHGDLFEPLPPDENYDVILANLPQTPVDPSQMTDPSQSGFFAGGDGTTFVIKAIQGCASRLSCNGRAYFQIDSLANPRGVEAAFREYGFEYRVLASVEAPLRYFEMEQFPTFERLRREGKSEFHTVCGVLVCRKTIYEAVLRG